MAKQTINIGAAPNDGTGTPLRTSFDYCNQNFTELYTATGPSGNNIVVPGTATISGNLTVDTNTLFVDSANDRVGVGTTSPAVRLNVADADNAANGTIRLGVGAIYSQIKMSASSTGRTDFTNVGNGVNGAYNFSIEGQDQYRIATSGVFSWYDGAGGTRMTLNSTGLGVGRSPSYKLDIAGVGNFDQLRVSAAAATNVALVNTTSGLTYTVYSANTASNGFNGFGIFDGSNYVLRIDSSGNTTLASATITGNTTLGDAQTDTATINGQLTARQGEFPSAVRAAASDYAAVTFDGATSGTRIISALTGQNIGTGDMSMWNRFRVFTTTGTTRYIAALSSSSTTADQASACILYINSIGGLVFYLYGATVSDFRYATISGFQTAYSGQVVDIVVTRTGATLKIYINGIDTAYSETTGGTPPAWSATITSTNLFIGQSTGTSNIFTGRIYRSVVFNRALSATDVTELITTGVNPADQWGTQTQAVGYNPAVLNGGFETNSLNASGTWATSANGTSTATIDTSGSFSRTGTNAGKLTLDGSGNFASFLLNNSNINTLAVSKRYRISFWARKGAASGACGVQFGSVAAGASYGNTGLVLTTSYANTVIEVVLSTDGGLTLARQSSSAAGSEIYIDDVEVTRIGAIVDLDFTVGAGYQATDRSTNALHGTLFNGVEFTQPKRVAVLYATTNTATNQHVFGTLAIPTNAIIEDIIVNSTGTATVTVRDAAAGNVIVNAASVVAGRQKLTIAQPFSSGGQLWVQSSTTATLQFTILYTIAA
jgi:hypothetical protein